MARKYLLAAAVAGGIMGSIPLSPVALAQSATLDHVMLVVGRNEAGVYDVVSGREMSRIPVTGASLDTMAIGNGVALFNNTGGNQVIAVNLVDGKEIARIPSSSIGGTRPVHAYLSPMMANRQYFVVLNDGVEANTPFGEAPTDSSLALIDVVPSSPTYLKPVGEVRLGHGHHKVAFSSTRARMVVSNIADCKDVLSVYDFSDPSAIKRVRSFEAKDFGFDGSTAMRTCDATGRAGVRLGPHGVGTSAATGDAYHFITGTGQIAVINIDADAPTMSLIQTAGVGGSTAKDMPGGRFIVVPQRTPREVQDRAGGIVCQIGQIAVIDAVERKLVAQTPMLYGDGNCTTSLVGKPEAAATASYLGFNKDGSRMFVALGTLGGAQNAAATVDLTLVFDMSDPRRPRQLAPIRTQPRQGSDIVMASGGRLAFIPNSAANTVSVVDTETLQVLQTVSTVEGPTRLSAFSRSTGPSKPVGPASLAMN
jgi:YVTN family beta-propeller protein